ncbi:MAG: response regulator [Planctomycetes bacterium]|nr:response regulator [Planctomycetota bacterium]
MKRSLKPTIIYVEDNHGDALLLQEALTERHHDDIALVVIDHGAKAMHYFEVKAKVKDIPPPHCILLDTHVPIVTGIQLITFIRSSPSYTGTPVYVFASESDYRLLRASTEVSKESFLIKPSAWEGFLDLADLLMASASAKADDTKASPADSQPEVHATGTLRLHPSSAENGTKP